MSQYTYRCGLEVHIQLSTESKLLCSCPVSDAVPNTNVCPVCMGLPGVLPVLNRRAVEYGVMLALALAAATSTCGVALTGRTTSILTCRRGIRSRST